ncbi:hypothetical protein BH11PAT2_BH11PAT2_09680 [soil metagenome]
MIGDYLDNPLVEVLDKLYELVGPELYTQVRPSVIARWQLYNNDPLVSDVLAGHTTFERYLEPLVRVNQEITAEGGTPPHFEAVAESAAAAFKMVAPLDSYKINITKDSPSRHEMSKRSLWLALVHIMIGGILGAGIAVAAGRPGELTISTVGFAAIALVAWMWGHRTSWASWSKSVDDRKRFAEGLLEDMAQLTKELRPPPTS